MALESFVFICSV